MSIYGTPLTASKNNTYFPGENISIINNKISTKAFPCNPNLLDNWYFGKPVNQRGQTNYTGIKYGIDRWKMWQADGTVTIENGGIVIRKSSGEYVQWGEVLEADVWDALVGQQVTMSVLTVNSQLATTTQTFTEGGILQVGAFEGLIFNSADTMHLIGFTLTSAESPVILAVKLELGSQQTLAHQENGVWVLNEIPDYGEQLRRCQRYCRVYPANKAMPCIAYPETDGWYLCATLWVGDMRTAPANNLGDGIACKVQYMNDGDTYDKTAQNWGLLSSGMQVLRLSGAQLPSDKRLFPYAVVPQVDLVFSADL